jgi:hypothetical protein
MTIYKFIEHAEKMRNGGICLVLGPRSYNHLKMRVHRQRKLEDAYFALWGFRIKHPDSTRTRKAKELGKMRKSVGRKWEVEG